MIFPYGINPYNSLLALENGIKYKSCPPVLLYHPSVQHEMNFHCPIHNDVMLTSTGTWTFNADRSYAPRWLKHFGTNCLLVSHLYHCYMCGSQSWMAHDALVMQQLPKSNLPKFRLFKRSAVTEDTFFDGDKWHYSR